jgi:hypothetical protein
VRGRIVTREAYLAAFDAWFTACRENGYGPAIDAEPAFRDAVAAGGLPDEAPVSDFCDVLMPRLPSRTVMFAVGKSSMLDRLLYGGETLRTAKCPTHKGHWSGLGIERCPHGCGHTGWLRPEGDRS